MYEIILGGSDNTWSYIFRPYQVGRIDPVVRIPAIGIINCNEHRPFWISWDDGEISVSVVC